MSKNKTGGPAFPGKHTEWIRTEQGFIDGHETFESSEKEIYHSGMSLRDWFAGQAIEGIYILNSKREYITAANDLAEEAYKIADAMLKERDK